MSFDKLKYKTYDTSKGKGNPAKWKEAVARRLKVTSVPYSQFPELFECKTKAELKKAYRKLSKTHHPDKGGNPEDFKLLTETYESILKVVK